MPRRARAAAGGVIYPVINRGNCRQRIFSKPGDFDAFVELLREGCRRVPGMRVLAYCLMGNHWHLALWPRGDGDLAKFVGWVSTTHVRRWRQHRRSVGEGHLYQGRYKSFPVQADRDLLVMLRYVEANAVRAEVVEHAREWPHGSLAARLAGGEAAEWLTEWPVDRPGDWEAELDAALDAATLDALHVSVARGRPFGSPKWVEGAVKRLGLEHTVRDPWRPKKPKPGERKPTARTDRRRGRRRS
jgi:putative transposase